MVNAHLANGERTWMNAEWTVCEHITEFGKGYVNGEQTQYVIGVQRRAQSEQWMQDERSILKASCVF